MNGDFRNLTTMMYVIDHQDQLAVKRLRRSRRSHRLWLSNMKFFYNIK